MLIYDAIAIVLLVYARIALVPSGIALWPAVVGHVLLAAWAIVQLQSN
jgi:hypothetical protein